MNKIGSFESNGQTVFFEGKSFKCFSFEKNDPSAVFMRVLQDCPGQEIAKGEIPNEGVFNLLTKNDFLVREPWSAEVDIPSKYQKNYGLRRSISLHLLLTQYCNLGCVYCYNGTESYQLKNKLRMTPENAKRALQDFLEYCDPDGKISVNFLGGEPLLNWSCASAVLRASKRLMAESGFNGKLEFSVQTNLVQIPPNFISDVKEFNVDVIVEVDGGKVEHDTLRPHKGRGVSSFEATKLNCNLLRRSGVKFRCKAVLTSQNIDNVDVIPEVHRELGAYRTSLGTVRPVDSDYLSFDTKLLPSLKQTIEAVSQSRLRNGNFFRSAKQEAFSRLVAARKTGTIGCSLKHATIFSITSDGQIFSCPWFVGSSKYFLGVVGRARLDESLVSEPVSDLGSDIDPSCADCEYFGACGGGCPVTKLLCSNDKDMIDHVRLNRCAQVKPAIRELLVESVKENMMV